MSFALLVLRTVIGAVFADHGGQKLQGKFGGRGPDGTGQFFESIGLHPGKPMALGALAAATAGSAAVIGAGQGQAGEPSPPAGVRAQEATAGAASS